MRTHKTVHDNGFQVLETDKEFVFQPVLTKKLDKGMALFDQGVINEIVLWKVNRYVNIDSDTLALLNDINIKAEEIDIEMTRKILMKLLQIKGIQLPMASTILRFNNNKIYQIIDQRVFRIIYEGKKLKLKTYASEKNNNESIDLYLEYLKDLTKVCDDYKIPFDKSDRILFMADKRINRDVPLDHYSTNTKERGKGKR